MNKEIGKHLCRLFKERGLPAEYAGGIDPESYLAGGQDGILFAVDLVHQMIEHKLLSIASGFEKSLAEELENLEKE